MESLWQDIRYGVRTLCKSPGFAVVAVFTLALGISASTTVFSVIDAVILRALPFPAPNQLVWAWGKFPLNDKAAISPPDFADYRSQSKSFDQLASMAFEDDTANLTGGDKPEQVRAKIVSWNFFDALGLRPKIGRNFLPDDENQSRPQVAILGYGVWQRDFGGDLNIVGRSLTLDGQPLTIVGVLPSDLSLLSEAQVWLPFPMLAKGMSMRRAHFLFMVGRLKANVSLEGAQRELEMIAAGLAHQFPDSNTDWSLRLVSLRDVLVGAVRPVLLLLFGAVSFLLLISCANVANLQLARVNARDKEIAIRAALGAKRSRILRQILTECTLLSLAAGILAAMASIWGIDILRAVAPQELTRLNEVHVNPHVFLFTGAISILSGILFGITPALRISARGMASSLKEGGRTSGNVTRHGLGRVLIVGEIAISFAMLVGAGVLLQSVWNLIHVNPGFRADHVATARINLSGAIYHEDLQKATFFRQLEDRLALLPGVQSVGFISELPLSRQLNASAFRIVDRIYAPNQSDDANFRRASLGYLKAMGIPLLSGRWFDDHDTITSPEVAVVNEPFAKHYFAGNNAIGQYLLIEDNPKPREIVGVIGGVSHFALNSPQPPEIYVPNQQSPTGSLNLVVRTSGDPKSLAPAIGEAVSMLDRNETISVVRSMDELVSTSIAQTRFSAQLLALFAAAALLLGAVGLYGLIAYLVAQRTQEMGVRLTLGARRSDILRRILWQGLQLALFGSAMGLVATLLLKRLLIAVVYGVSPVEPSMLAAVFVLLVVVTLLASYTPAHRAASIDPMKALRNE